MTSGIESRAKNPSKAAAAALDAIYQEATPVFATREIVYGGRKLQPGESTFLSGGKFDALLLEQGVFVPSETWKRIQAEAEAAHYEADVLKPARLALVEAEQALREAAAQLEHAAEVKAARTAAAAAAKDNLDQVVKDAPALVKI